MTHTATHTPLDRTAGTWEVLHNNSEDRTYIVARDRYIGDDIVAEVYRLSAYEGNASLLAAAPAMYEALGELVAYLRNHVADEVLDNWAPVLKAAYALAQAEGEQL